MSASTKELMVTILDLGARKPVARLPMWQAHMRLDQLKQEFPAKRFTLTSVS